MLEWGTQEEEQGQRAMLSVVSNRLGFHGQVSRQVGLGYGLRLWKSLEWVRWHLTTLVRTDAKGQGLTVAGGGGVEPTSKNSPLK